MDFLENIKVFLVSIVAFLRMCPKFFLPRSQPPPSALPIVDLESNQQPTLPSLPPSANDPETLQPESPPPTINQLESSEQPIQPSPTPSTNENDPETLQPHTPPPPPPSPTFNIELPQPPFPTNQPESSQPLPTNPTTPSNLKQLESIIAAQQHQQWKNSVLSFCFSYPLAVSLQYAQTVNQADQPNASLVFLSFLVLLAFNLILVASFIGPSCTQTSEKLELNVAFQVAAAAFCHATAIPFPFELKCAVLAVFLLSLLLITIFLYLNRNIA